MEEIKINISIGEFLDHLSILEIKMERIEDEEKRAAVFQELKSFKANKAYKGMTASLEAYETYQKLKRVNANIWKHVGIQNKQIKEDNLDAGFVDSAANVVLLNNERFHLKNDLNKLLGKNFNDYSCTEVKDHI